MDQEVNPELHSVMQLLPVGSQRHPGAELMHLSAARLVLSAHPRLPPYPVV
jgi:hypothetical protein